MSDSSDTEAVGDSGFCRNLNCCRFIDVALRLFPADCNSNDGCRSLAMTKRMGERRVTETDLTMMSMPLVSLSTDSVPDDWRHWTSAGQSWRSASNGANCSLNCSSDLVTSVIMIFDGNASRTAAEWAKSSLKSCLDIVTLSPRNDAKQSNFFSHFAAFGVDRQTNDGAANASSENTERFSLNKMRVTSTNSCSPSIAEYRRAM